MVNKAIAKITEEMMKCNSPFAEFIEEYLTSICTNEAVATKLLNPNKNLEAFVTDVTKQYEQEARKRGTGLQAAGDKDQVFFKKAEAYYDITDADKSASAGVIDIRDLL